MWLDTEKTPQQVAGNPLVALNLKENVTGDILGIELEFADSHSPFFKIGEEADDKDSGDEEETEETVGDGRNL